MAYHNWKRILAAVGTAALLVSNMGSVTHAVFAVEGQSEEVTGEEPEVEPEVEPQVDPEIPEESVPEGSSEQGGSSQPEGEGNTNQNTNGGNNAGGEQGGNHNNIGGEQGGSNDDQNAGGNNAGGNNDQKGDGGNGDSAGGDQGVTGGDNVAGGEGNPDGQPAGGETTPEPETPAITEGGSEDDKGSKETPAPQTYALSDSLKVTLETTESKKHDPAVDETDGAYLYDLGETASTTVTLTNPEDYTLAETDGAVVRVYMQFTDAEPVDDPDQESTDASTSSDTENDEDAEGSDHKTDDASDDKQSVDPEDLHGKTRKPGKYTVEAERKDHQDTEDNQTSEAEETTDDQHSEQEPNEYTYTVTQIEDGLYCYETDRPIDGDTISLELTSVYSKDSYGGENQIWAEITPAENTDEEGESEEQNSEEVTEYQSQRLYEQTLRWVITDAEPEEIYVRTATTTNYSVSVAYGPEAGIPDNAELKVVEYMELDEEFQEALAQVHGSMEWFLDVSFYVNGEEIEPNEAIAVSVKPLTADADIDDRSVTEGKARDVIAEAAAYTQDGIDVATLESDVESDNMGAADDDATVETVKIVHFAQTGLETVTAELSDTATTFTLDSLSRVAQLASDNGIMLAEATTSAGNEMKTVTIPARPTYDKSSSMSGSKTGTENGSDIDIKLQGSSADYASDPETSDIEKDFTGTQDQNGKVVTDKSVVYNNDGQFDVTLSALAQEFAVDERDTVRAPIDVVFVIDTSRSMDTKIKDANGNNTSTSRRTATVNAVNNAISQILANHEENRVGVVTFSSGAWKVLDLGRYTGNSSGKYIQESQSDDGPYVAPADGVSIEKDGAIHSQSFYTGKYAGTFTQAGIAMAYQVFNSVSNTTYDARYRDANGDYQTITVTRKPVVVLLSDGDPTYCDTNYSSVLTISSNGTTIWNNGNNRTSNSRYGNGSGTTVNNQGVLGYYTILSAVSYKQQIAQKYYGNSYSKNTQYDADFYTIGMGINETGTDNSSGSDNSRSGDHYKRTVLNPVSDNISDLNNKAGGSGVTSNDDTAKQLYKLLMHDWTYTRRGQIYNDSISVSAGNNTYTGQMGGGTNGTINDPQINYPSSNPTNQDYAYADASWFGTDITEDQLKDYFFSALMWSQGYQDYDFVLEKNVSMVITDPIGTGMAIKTEPILRFGNNNYSATSSETADGVTTYHYNYSVPYATAYPLNAGTDGLSRKVKNATGSLVTDASGNYINVTYDLNRITVKVTTDQDGDQSVRMEIPQDLMPALYPERYGKFYYEETPIRLQFQVGLSEAGVQDAVTHLDKGESVTYYTNAYSGTTTAAVFSKDQSNVYPFDRDSDAGKTDNPTETIGTSFSTSINSAVVTQSLGNNGELIFKPGLKVTKKWLDSSGNELEDLSEQPAITGTLHRSYIESTDSVTVTLRYSYRQYRSRYQYWYDWEDPIVAETIAVKPNSSFAFYLTDTSGNQHNLYYNPEANPSSAATATYSTENGIRVVYVTVGTQDVTISVGTNTIYAYDETPTARAVYTTDYQRPGTGQSVEDSSFSKSFALSNNNAWKARWSPRDLNEDPNRTYSYWVTEDEVEGYTTSIDYYDLSHGLILTDDNRTITITNQQKPSYELPSTGGSGTWPMEMGGSAAILASMFAGCSMWRRRRSERRCN